MRRIRPQLLLLLCLPLLFALSAAAGERDPSPAELARMILKGNAAEHALVAAWLEEADRGELRAVFAALRELRSAGASAPDFERYGDPARRTPAPKALGRGEDPWAEPEAGQRLVNLEARILEIGADAALAVLGAHHPQGERTATGLTGEEAAALLRAVEAHEQAALLSAPRLTVYDKQKANVSILNQISYVQDYDVEKTNDSFIADPIIGVLQEGLTLDVQPTVDADGKHLRLEATATLAHIKRPIPELELELAGLGEKVKIQLPEVEVQKQHATVRVPDGGWVLLAPGLRTQLDDGRVVERFVLLHARVITVDAAFLEDLKKDR